MKDKVYLIIIAGGSASGKTTVGNKIANEILKDQLVQYISMDNYYKKSDLKEYKDREKINYDHPNSYDIDLLVEHLLKLKRRETIQMPVYDFTQHQRSNEVKEVKPADVIMLDGILALYIKELLNLADIKIFIKTASDVRFIRRLTRDINERQRSMESVIEQYLTSVKPMHEAFVAPSMNNADIIIPYYEGNAVAIDIIATKLSTLIKNDK